MPKDRGRQHIDAIYTFSDGSKEGVPFASRNPYMPDSSLVAQLRRQWEAIVRNPNQFDPVTVVKARVELSRLDGLEKDGRRAKEVATKGGRGRGKMRRDESAQTKERYQRWQKWAEELKSRRPRRSKSDICEQIAREEGVTRQAVSKHVTLSTIHAGRKGRSKTKRRREAPPAPVSELVERGLVRRIRDAKNLK